MEKCKKNQLKIPSTILPGNLKDHANNVLTNLQDSERPSQSEQDMPLTILGKNTPMRYIQFFQCTLEFQT